MPLSTTTPQGAFWREIKSCLALQVAKVRSASAAARPGGARRYIGAEHGQLQAALALRCSVPRDGHPPCEL
jgi:hypothetical protein